MTGYLVGFVDVQAPVNIIAPAYRRRLWLYPAQHTLCRNQCSFRHYYTVSGIHPSIVQVSLLIHNINLPTNHNLRIPIVPHNLRLTIPITQFAIPLVPAQLLHICGELAAVALAVSGELVCRREPRRTGAAVRATAVVLAHGLVEDGAEERTEGRDVADCHAEGVLGETPDDDVCDGEEEVGLVGQVDGIFQADAGGDRSPVLLVLLQRARRVESTYKAPRLISPIIDALALRSSCTCQSRGIGLFTLALIPATGLSGTNIIAVTQSVRMFTAVVA